MARKYAMVQHGIWKDDDFRALSVAAQLLYLQVLSSATLSYAGVADWRPSRLSVLSSDATRESVEDAAYELERGLFLIMDEESEEVLVRSFFKHDGLLLKPNVTKAMVKAFDKVTSVTLRGVIAHELGTLHERNPDWSGFGIPEIAEVFATRSVNPSELIQNRSRKGSAKGSGRGCKPDASLLTPNSILHTPGTIHPSTSEIAIPDAHHELCTLLVDLMVSNGDKPPAITKQWDVDARLLIEKDGRDLDAAKRLLTWTLNDSFWRGNIQSMPKFRKQFDQLRHHANRQREERAKPLTRTEENMQAVLDMRAREQAAGEPVWGELE